MLKRAFIACICALSALLPGCELWATLPAPSGTAPVKTHTSKPTQHAASPAKSPSKTKSAMPDESPAYSPLPSPTAPEVSASASPQTAEYRIKCQSHVTLRTAPSSSAKSLARLKNKEHVQVTCFSGAFAAVTDSNGRTGYVLSGYLLPIKKDPWLAGLSVVKPVEKYSYDQMVKDLQSLALKYPKNLKLESAGKSTQGRDIPVAVLGDPDAPRQVLLQGAVHAREYMTSELMMAQLEYCLKYPSAPCGDTTVGQSLDGVCLRILPMANPDGVTISQSQKMTDDLKVIYQQDKARKLTDQSQKDYLQTWKANALGVDINRNFPAGWALIESPNGPSALRYKGAAPGDQPETAALMAYTKQRHYDATVSYHATGGEIYWQYADKQAVNSASRSLANTVQVFTQYDITGAEGLDSGGYKDWAMDALGIPSVTIEVGSRECPLPPDEFATVWARNLNVPAAVAQWVKAN